MQFHLCNIPTFEWICVSCLSKQKILIAMPGKKKGLGYGIVIESFTYDELVLRVVLERVKALTKKIKAGIT